MNRKNWGLLLVLMLIFCSSYASANDEHQSGLFTYKLKGNGTAVITGFDWENNNGADIYIPQLIDGYPVTEIGDYAFIYNRIYNYSRDLINNEEFFLTKDFFYAIYDGLFFKEGISVIIPNSIKSIGERAFFLTEVKACSIPDSVEYIGRAAFEGCRLLESFDVGKNNET